MKPPTAESLMASKPSEPTIQEVKDSSKFTETTIQEVKGNFTEITEVKSNFTEPTMSKEPEIIYATSQQNPVASLHTIDTPYALCVGGIFACMYAMA